MNQVKSEERETIEIYHLWSEHVPRHCLNNFHFHPHDLDSNKINVQVTGSVKNLVERNAGCMWKPYCLCRVSILDEFTRIMRLRPLYRSPNEVIIASFEKSLRTQTKRRKYIQSCVLEFTETYKRPYHVRKRSCAHTQVTSDCPPQLY